MKIHFVLSSRCRLLLAIFGTLVILTTTYPAEASTRREWQRHRRHMLEDLRKAEDPPRWLFGPAKKVYQAAMLGWAAGKAALANGCFLATQISFEGDRYTDAIAFDQPVEGGNISLMDLSNEVVAAVFDQRRVDPLVQQVYNETMSATAPVLQAVGAFHLADARVLGALSAGDHQSAQDRFGEMVRFYDSVVTTSEAAIGKWSELGQILQDAGLNYFFDAAATAAVQDQIAANGSDALPHEFLNAMRQMGYSDDRIDQEIIPLLVDLPVGPEEQGDIIDHIDAEIQLLQDIGHSLGNILQSNEQLLFPQTGADFNGDGSVDGNDFLVWQRGFGGLDGDATHADGDANGDGRVDGNDFLVWQQNFGGLAGGFPSGFGGQSHGVGVPEPSASLLLACGLLTLSSARRKHGAR